MDFAYKTSFSSQLRVLVSEDKDKYLAMASFLDIGNFLPNIDTDSNKDVLPVAFDACVINKINKNDDGIITKIAQDRLRPCAIN